MLRTVRWCLEHAILECRSRRYDLGVLLHFQNKLEVSCRPVFVICLCLGWASCHDASYVDREVPNLGIARNTGHDTVIARKLDVFVYPR